MVIDVQCEACRKRYRVKDNLAGRRIKCKQCEAVMVVPDPMSADDEWGDYEDEPELPPPRAKSAKRKPNRKKTTKPVSEGPGLGKKVFAVIGMALGVVVAIGSVVALLNGTPRAVRGIGTGCIITAVSFGWFRGT